MEAIVRSRRLLRALGVLACAALAPALMVGTASARSLRAAPTQTAGSSVSAGSPLKLAHSAAHGIVYRKGAAPRSKSLFARPMAEACISSCASPLLYHEGSVMHGVKTYLILWEPPEPGNNGQEGTTFEKVPAGYVSTVEGFLRNVAAESGTHGNVYSVDGLYGETGVSGEYRSEFGGTFMDRHLYPARETATCPTSSEVKGAPPASQPCISDGRDQEGKAHFQLHHELLRFLEEHPTLSLDMKAIYFMLTPHGVNSCSGYEGGTPACNTNVYCAYHSAVPFTYEGSATVHHLVYANMPYDDVSGCEIPDQPNGGPADDEINTLSHEDNEAITDPLFGGWYDYQGYEVADKCTYPFFSSSIDFNAEEDAYGELLGGTPAEYETQGTGEEAHLVRTKLGNAYNQEMSSGHYLLQREWSNAAGGCVTRAPAVHAAFGYEPSPPVENVQVNFNGSESSTQAGQIESYEWEFGDPGSGAANTSTEADPTHIYAAAGSYTVKLTVTNNSGVTESVERELAVGRESEAKVVTSTSTATTTTSITTTQRETSSVTETTTASFTTGIPVISLSSTTTTVTAQAPEPVPARYSSNGIASLLKLPSKGARRAGLGSIALGVATCAPACVTTVQVRATIKVRRRARHIWIGRSQLKLQSRQTGGISVRLSRRGRTLLKRHRRLSVTLIVKVEDRQGASWRIVRPLKLTLGGSAARSHGHRRRGRAARHRRRR